MASSKKETIKLYKNQELLLQILYKFRFGTNDQIASYRGLTRRSINKSMSVLQSKDLVVMKFDKTNKFRGEPAVYYLSTKGLAYLKSRLTLHPKIIQANYKNYLVSDQFIQHNLAIFKTYLILKRYYNERYDIFTKAELAMFEQYPEQLPDLFLASKTGEKDYMLNIYLHEPFFVIKKRIKYYIEHRNEEWSDNQPYPSILLVCPDARNEAKVIKYTESQLEDFDFLVTTVKALFGGDENIWSNPVEPERLVRL